jgi:hypothetical protein
VVRPRRIADIKPIFTNVAQTSQYEVKFGGFNIQLQNYLAARGVDPRFTGETVGLLCNSASLPGSSFATADISGNYTGVMEKFAHTRIFTPIDLTFYVDRDYKTMKFLEHWMEYMSSASNVSPNNDGYYFKMKYPNQYKCDFTKITKFNRDYKVELEYRFFGLFPMALSSVAVSYDSSQLMTVSATFNYERYVSGPIYSIDNLRGSFNNLVPSIMNKTIPTVNPASIDEYRNFYDIVKQTQFSTLPNTSTLPNNFNPSPDSTVISSYTR